MRGADVFRHPERSVPTLQDYRAAAARIAPYVRRTPVLRAAVGGRPVSLKLEHLQVAGVFKIRGAVNALLARGDDPPEPPGMGGSPPPISRRRGDDPPEPPGMGGSPPPISPRRGDDPPEPPGMGGSPPPISPRR